MGGTEVPPIRREIPARTPGRARRYFEALAVALSLEPAVTLTALAAGTWIVSPVCGLRPVRAARRVRSNDRNPGRVSFSLPAETTLETSSSKPFSTFSTSALATPDFSEIAATSSVFVIVYSFSGLGGFGETQPGEARTVSSTLLDRPPGIKHCEH